jgi:arylsulfatase A-like enzyme
MGRGGGAAEHPADPGGRSPAGVWDNRTHFRTNIPDAVTLPEYFKMNGYATYSYGKVFHSHLFEDPKSWTLPNRGADPTWRRYAARENLTGELKEAPVERLGADASEVRNVINDSAYGPVRSAMESDLARVMAERLGHAGLATTQPEE